MKRLFVSNQKLDMLAIVQSQTRINLQAFATGYPSLKNDSYVLNCSKQQILVVGISCGYCSSNSDWSYQDKIIILQMSNGKFEPNDIILYLPS